MTLAHLEKLRVAQLKRWQDPATRTEILKGCMKGKHHTEETKNKMRAARLKQVISPEHMRKMAEINTGKKQSVDTIRKREVSKSLTLKLKREKKAALEFIGQGLLI